MATKNPTFNLKTGAESDLIVAREVTQGDSTGKIKRNEDVFRFPYLTRRTGDSITGSTENIESNELKHGRTKSAPRKGTSSSSGDINFEFSSETFDDMMEAVFRGKWKRWESDTTSPSNKKKNSYDAGFFATKCAEGAGGKKLIYDGTGSGDSIGLIHTANNGQGFIVHELNSETEDIKYSLLRKYGGQTGEDLWQEFTHCALNTMQLSVEINSIVTGSFGIMGTNNPKLMNSDEVVKHFETRMENISNNDDLIDRGVFKNTEAYAVGDMVLYEGDHKCYKCKEAVSAGAWDSAKWDELEAYEYIDSIPDHTTDTLQFTAREGFLHINGKQIEFAQNLSFTLDNGLAQKFAIFVPNAISTVPLELNINGDLSTYLVGGESEAKALFNNAVDDKDVELLWCFQDKLEDPTALYVFQIFNAKHTENTINGNGNDTYDESLPWQSFREQACRVFRIILPRITEGDAVEITAGTPTGIPNTVLLTPNVMLDKGDLAIYNASTAPNGFTIKIEKSGTSINFAGVVGYKYKEGNATVIKDNSGTDVSSTANIILDLTDGDTYGQILLTPGITADSSEHIISVTVTWHGEDFIYSYTLPASS